MNNTTSSLVSESIAKSTELISVMDPNWLYSTIAQSSAAIVGIIGAFFTTRVINQRLQIGTLEREIRSKKQEMDFLEDSIKHKEEYIDQIDEEDNLGDAKDFLEKIEDALDPENPPKIKEIIELGNQDEDDTFHNLSEDALKKVYNPFISELKEKKKHRGFF
jgi:septal ring factor EnvC (AmiA/AmiB activator)